MNNKTTLQNHLESFKSQMKEVNESLYKFESQFEKERAKIEKLRHSFCFISKLINKDLIKQIDLNSSLLEKIGKLLEER